MFVFFGKFIGEYVVVEFECSIWAYEVVECLVYANGSIFGFGLVGYILLNDMMMNFGFSGVYNGILASS